MELIKVEIKRIIGPTPSGAAVLLGNDEKTFVVFVGFFEAMALLREMNHEKPPRPLTHELIQNICLGFDIEVKQIVISSIIEHTFCATLTVQQRIGDNGEWTGRRNEVRIDARPSDCLVLALKNGVDIYVADEVFRQVQDVSKMTAEVEGNLASGVASGEFDLGFPSEGDFSSPTLDDEDDLEESSEEFGGLGGDEFLPEDDDEGEGEGESDSFRSY